MSGLVTTGEKNLVLVSGRAHLDLAQAVGEEIGCGVSPVTAYDFASGEIYVRFNESVRGADVFVLQSIAGDINKWLMEQFIMIDAAKRASARSITAVITHYGYSRQERKAAPREPITAKLVADLLSVAGIDNAICIDLHASATQGFFDVPVNHMTAMPIFVDYFEKKGFDPADLCIVSPDVGRAKEAKKMQLLLDSDIAIMHKDRPRHNQAEITALIGDVTGKICIINDDMIDTGGSLVAAADTLKAKGADCIYACATHGILSGPAFDRIENSCIEEVVVTNTIPVPLDRQTGKIKVISVAPLLAKTIKNVYENGSVSGLFA